MDSVQRENRFRFQVIQGFKSEGAGDGQKPRNGAGLYSIPEGYPWRDLPQALRESYIQEFLDSGGGGVHHYDIFSEEDYERHLLELDSYIQQGSVYYDSAYFLDLKEQVIQVFGPHYQRTVRSVR